MVSCFILTLDERVNVELRYCIVADYSYVTIIPDVAPVPFKYIVGIHQHRVRRSSVASW